MSWGNITGDSSILPSSGYGVQDEVKFESGKGVRLRLVLKDGDEPYSYLEHCLEVETMEGGQLTRTFRTIRCPKTHKNPNAPCPLCDGQQVRRRVRHACNVWSYDESKMMKLNAGESVFKPIATTMKMGINILDVDWAIMKTGTNRNDTEYTATNLGVTPNPVPPDAPYYNMEECYAPNTIDEMKAIVEGAGGDWNALIVPPQLTYPTLAEALEHEMPNGKYKGQKFRDIWEQDKSNRGMISFLALKSDRISPEKAAAQVILVRLGGVPIDGVPTQDGAQPTTTQVPVQNQQVQNQQPVQATQQPVQQAQQTPVQEQTTNAQAEQPVQQPSGADRQSKIQEINKLLSSKEKFIKGGYNEILAVMQQTGNGKSNIVDFTDAELDNMLEACRNA